MSGSGEILVLKDHATGAALVGFLAVRKSSVGMTRGEFGKQYLNLSLFDGETEITAKQWDFGGQPPEENTVIKVAATMDSYQGQPQLIISKWRPVEPGECTQKFIPVCPQNIDEMKHQLAQHIIGITHEGLHTIVRLTINAYEEMFCNCPAGMYHHQNYIGGLLEHTLGVVKIAKKLAFGENVNLDLLVAGALLHDIGKIYDYNWEGCTITFTDEGKMIGHVANGLIVLETIYTQHPTIGLDKDTFRLLNHMVASHPGELEWGAVVKPVIKEALILHRADQMDTEWWKIDKAESEAEPGKWTKKVLGFNKEFFVVPR